ncbi:hypothetical protein LZ554_001850 [Drepanopeziza brunnea f. sp. 'monogermtubi']|nr:hypothetical protein LZ554_001850 [Drepanopeziza brunnea f. sp. 'monogermtubi']
MQERSVVLAFQTAGFKGYDAKFSPFYDNKLAVAASSNYGLVGNGRGYILNLTDNGIVCQQSFTTADALYAITWSEQNEAHVIAACGDGTIKVFDINEPSGDAIMNYKEHSREVYSVAFNLVSKDNFVSSSWDGTIKLWSPTRTFSQLTLPTHSCTYSVAFSPHSPSIISAVSSDSHLRVFDIRTPTSASNHLCQLIPVHGYAPRYGQGPARIPNALPNEVLTHDWNKYRQNVVATAGVDQIIRVIDLRNPKAGPIAVLGGHEYAIRKLAWSPHFSDVLLSGSYDMSARVWTDGSATGPNPMNSVGPAREIGKMDLHTEFVTGVDWCIHGEPGWVATTGWDERVAVWDASSPQFCHG